MVEDFIKDDKKFSKILIFIIFLLAIIYFANYLTPNKMIYGSDWILSGYSERQSWVNYIKLNKRLPMWDESNFSGHPIMTTRGGGGMVYPLNIFYFVLPVHFGWTVMYTIHLFLAGMGMFLLLKEFKLSSLASLTGACTFMFAGQLITTTEGGHLARMIAAVYLPYSFLFLSRALRRRRIIDFIIFGGITGLFILAGHVQISYWGMIGVVIYFLYDVSRRSKKLQIHGMFRLSGLFIVSIIILFLILSIKLLPPALSLGYGARGITRGYVYTTSWSIPTSELINLIAPHFTGILQNYWGENFFKLDSRYLGILPIILFGCAFFYKKDKHLIKYFAFFTFITLLLALGKNTPIFKIYYYLIPMAKKFRGPSMFFFLTTFGVTTLTGFGMQAIIDAIEEKQSDTKKKKIFYLFIATGIIFLFTLIINIGDRGILRWLNSHFIEEWTGILSRSGIQQKMSILMANFDNLKKSLWISTMLFIINGGLIFSIIKNKIDYRIAIPVLLLILLIDVWSIDRKYLRSVESPKEYFAPDDITRFLSSDNDIFRVFPLNYENRDRNGYFQYHGIDNVGGYGPNPPRRYQEFIGAGNSVIFSAPNFFIYPHTLSMLNVKYIIAPLLPEDLSKYPESTREIIEQYRTFYSNFEPVGSEGRYLVLKNTNYLPRASLVSNYSVVKTENEALNTVLSPTFNAGNIVILEDNPNEKNFDNKGSVSVIKYISNERIFKVSSEKSEFLLIRENYHPHWNCYINGEKEKVYRANYVFYGVFVPEGNHEVQFVYESKMFNIVSLFSLIGFLILISAVIISFRYKKINLEND